MLNLLMGWRHNWLSGKMVHSKVLLMNNMLLRTHIVSIMSLHRNHPSLGLIGRVMKHRHSSWDIALIDIMKGANGIRLRYYLRLYTSGGACRLLQVLVVITLIILGLLRIPTLSQI